MHSLIVYPKTKAELSALKAIMKAMKIPFIQQDETVVLPPNVIEGVKRSIAQADSGLGLHLYTGIQDMLKKE